MEKTKKFLLAESEIPTQWYNIAADLKKQTTTHASSGYERTNQS